MKKIILFFVAFSFTGLLLAQNKGSDNFSFNHMALSVKDVNRSVAFYTTVFGLQEITNRSAIEGIRWISFGEGKELHLISVIKEEIKLNKAIHLALSTANIDAFVKLLNEKKIAYSDWPGKPNTVNIRADGIKQVYLQDPDGYWIEINNVGQ